MDSKTIRYNNTRLLVEQVGGVSNFANKINKGQSQTSQFAGTAPIKGIGNKVAREIEEAFGKPHGWLDVIHQEKSSQLPPNTLENVSSAKGSEELQVIIRSLNDLESKGKLSSDVIQALKTMISLIN
ncbi:hypothetical protein [Acinetobacter modestus]|uniref:hypothetical protein n=1 Tax=Acinetobacter modestus TaxID=1776740 RepID=UPI001F4BB393|nr:hypothetical protein [Acinetobacter modestus]MCH7333864.1 hypothetical protein [Acinetobacter modestus]